MHPDTILYEDEAKSRKWNYEQGLMLEAFYQMWRHTGDTSYFQYFGKNLDFYVREDGSIATYKLEDFNLDNIAPGKALLRMYRLTRNNKYMRAAETLRRQLDGQPRTKSGGFWHKKIYPFQMWLDGLYMAEPFYTEYSALVGDSAGFDDIARQFLLIRENNRDSGTGLYFHGWDESRTQRWADQATGLSPNLWGRSIGWMCMALVDVLEAFPEQHKNRKDLLQMLGDLAERVWKARDPESNLWFQVVDRPGDQGNYLEASASAMFTYAFVKGARLGYLPAEFKERGWMSFEGIVKHLVTIDDGVVHLHQVCKVSGLGGDPYRDGSYAYYVGEPKRTDDFKGYGPFLLAAIELERN
jgi:unsaturated rhamnogalacturonyl hydrolase